MRSAWLMVFGMVSMSCAQTVNARRSSWMPARRRRRPLTHRRKQMPGIPSVLAMRASHPVPTQASLRPRCWDERA